MQWSIRVRFVQCDTQRIETARTWMPRVCWITWICKWICQKNARRKRCGRGGFLLKAFMNEYKTKQQGTQVDTTLVGSRVGSRVHTHARSVFSTTRALFTPTPLLLKTAMLLKTANIIGGQSSRKDPPQIFLDKTFWRKLFGENFLEQRSMKSFPEKI